MVKEGLPALYKDPSEGEASPFFPGILVFRKPSTTQAKRPVVEKKEWFNKNGESTLRQIPNHQLGLT